MNEEPLEAGRIRFSPLAGTATPSTSVGVVDGSDSTTVEEGLMEGSYHVEVEAEDASPDEPDLLKRLNGMVVLGGAHMGIEKFDEVEVLTVQ